MKAIRFSAYGGPAMLHLDDIAAPVPGHGEVLVAMHAASVNPIDWKLRAGLMQDVFPLRLPAICGRDGAGVVAAAGDGAALALGTRVCFMAGRDQGTWAEQVVMPAAKLAVVPAELDLITAAALPLAGLSAWAALVQAGDLLPGQRVLIHGAAGGVGSLAVQLARHLGAEEVVATCSAANLDFVRGLGADQVIAYDREDFSAICRDLDVVFDTVGGEVHRRSYPVLRRGGTLVRLNALPIEDCADAFGVTSRMATTKDDLDALVRLVALAAAGVVVPPIERVLPLERAAEAQRLSETGHARGKTVLAIAPGR